MKNVGDRYGAMLPSQYVVSTVETMLSVALSSLKQDKDMKLHGLKRL